MYDYNKATEAWLRFNEEFQCDHLVSPAMLLPGKFYERLDYRLYAWPGHGMPDGGNGYQYVEGEYMKADEYDDLIKDFSGYLTRTFMARAFGALAPLASLPPDERDRAADLLLHALRQPPGAGGPPGSHRRGQSTSQSGSNSWASSACAACRSGFRPSRP